MSAIEISLGAAIKIVKGLIGLDLGGRIDRNKIDQALQSLREIYFFNPDIKLALSQIARSGKASPDILDKLEEGFKEIPESINNSLTYLEIEKFSQNNELMLEELQRMSDVRYTKISLRIRLRSILSPRHQSEETVASVKRAASDMLKQIEQLNSEIGKLEKILLAARAPRGRSRSQPSS